MLRCSDMITEQRKTVWRNTQARDFPGLMELYEDNYIRLRRLIPDLDALPEHSCSRLSGNLDLHLRVLERCKYTTTLNLTYYFQDRQGEFPAPDIQVRIYHDAQVAEVMSCGRRRGVRHADYDRARNDYPMDRKWQINRFLHKWLGYSLHQGHRFLPPLPDEIWSALALEADGILSVES